MSVFQIHYVQVVDTLDIYVYTFTTTPNRNNSNVLLLLLLLLNVIIVIIIIILRVQDTEKSVFLFQQFLDTLPSLTTFFLIHT